MSGIIGSANSFSVGRSQKRCTCIRLIATSSSERFASMLFRAQVFVANFCGLFQNDLEGQRGVGRCICCPIGSCLLGGRRESIYIRKRKVSASSKRARSSKLCETVNSASPTPPTVRKSEPCTTSQGPYLAGKGKEKGPLSEMARGLLALGGTGAEKGFKKGMVCAGSRGSLHRSTFFCSDFKVSVQ